MVARSHERGHEIIFDRQWLYADTRQPVGDRPCKRCGREPVEGRDACLGHIPGATAACCGHGVGPGYVQFGGVACLLTFLSQLPQVEKSTR